MIDVRLRKLIFFPVYNRFLLNWRMPKHLSSYLLATTSKISAESVNVNIIEHFADSVL